MQSASKDEREVMAFRGPGLRARTQFGSYRGWLGVISLGCDKATVDSERLVGDLVGHGAVLTRTWSMPTSFSSAPKLH